MLFFVTEKDDRLYIKCFYGDKGLYVLLDNREGKYVVAPSCRPITLPTVGVSLLWTRPY